MSGITAPGETSPESQTPQQTPQESGSSLPPAARTRAEWKDFLQKEELDRLQIIQKERDEKKRKADELRTTAATQKTTESWTNNKAERPTLLGMDITNDAKAKISKNVDEELAKNMALFSEVGLNSPENVSSIKNVAKEIIFEHFTKTGATESVTESYVEKELVPKLEETFEALKAIYEQNKNLFASPLQFMETFGTFCGLNIIQNGRVNEPAIKTLLLIQKSGLQNLVNGFREYVPANADVERLNKDAAALLETGRQRSGQTAQATPAPAPGVTPPTPQAPGTAPTSSPGTAPQTVPASAETAPQSPGATPAETPQADTTAQSATTPETQPGTAGQTPPEGQTTPASEETSTGHPILDKIMSALKSLFPAGFLDQIMSLLGMSPAAAAEFASLTDPEKKEALILKEAANQLQLNEKVMTILYKDGEQVKKILADKSGLINTGWTEYLQQRIDPQEMELLKKDPVMDTQTADKISAMFLSPTTAAPPSATPPPATPPSAATPQAAPSTPPPTAPPPVA